MNAFQKSEIIRGLEFKESVIANKSCTGILLIYFLLEYYSAFYENEILLNTEDFYGIQFLYQLPI